MTQRTQPMVCAQCGSLDCEETVWRKINTGEIVGEGGHAPLENVWCPVCQSDDATIVPLEESKVCFYVFDCDGNTSGDVEGYPLLETAISFASRLALAVPEPEQVSVRSCGNGGLWTGRGGPPVVLTMLRVDTALGPTLCMKFGVGGEPRVVAVGPL